MRTGDGGGSSQTADDSLSYVNEDGDSSLNVHRPLTKNPAYGLPQVASFNLIMSMMRGLNNDMTIYYRLHIQ